MSHSPTRETGLPMCNVEINPVDGRARIIQTTHQKNGQRNIVFPYLYRNVVQYKVLHLVE